MVVVVFIVLFCTEFAELIHESELAGMLHITVYTQFLCCCYTGFKLRAGASSTVLSMMRKCIMAKVVESQKTKKNENGGI